MNNATRRRNAAKLIVLTLLVGACSSSQSDTPKDTTTSSTQPKVQELSWRPCGEIECSSLLVPFDYDDSTIGQFTLHITRRPAENPGDTYAGPLLVNPGGPGFGGSSLAEDAQYYFSQDIIDNFDIIGFDPRGTGKSTPALDCIVDKDFDKYFGADNTPNNDAELDSIVELNKEFVDECKQRSGTILQYVTTANTARDMDMLRRALKVDTITYFGFSYGSELGATWATMFPDTVRAAVLDGASDPDSDAITGALQQAAGFEKSLDTFLARCGKDAECPFHSGGNPGAAFDKLMNQLDTKPLIVSRDRAPVNRTVALTGVAEAMYSESYWTELEQALADARDGDGGGLLALYDSYYQRSSDGRYGNELEAFISITCADDLGPRSVAELDAYNDQFIKAAPRLGVSFIHSYTCVFWPIEPNTRVEVTGAGAGPIVVVGTTGDPATPYASTQNMANALEGGILVTVNAEGHTGYGANECVVSAVDTYLITLKAPKVGLDC